MFYRASGPALNHFKQSIILSRALDSMLDSTLVLTSKNSEHHYSTSQLYNGRMNAAPMDARKACWMRDHVPTARRNTLIWRIAWASWTSTRTRSPRLHHGPGPRMAGTYHVAPTSPASLMAADAVSDGRCAHPLGGWSNVAGQFRGSMALSNIVCVLKDLRAQVGQHGVNLTVAMENVWTSPGPRAVDAHRRRRALGL
ncbi:hypothetical protein DFH09DRAFT_1313130 [Mycena vulgaris]|nr:hypothetical protein DFH09DRAFT_1313130 [Mycena vulgaris]